MLPVKESESVYIEMRMGVIIVTPIHYLHLRRRHYLLVFSRDLVAENFMAHRLVTINWQAFAEPPPM